MSKSRRVTCKLCGEEFSYTERSYTKKTKYGHSRPQYCDECRVGEKAHREPGSLPYFDPGSVDPKLRSESSGGLGVIERSERSHSLIEVPSAFDQKNYGLVPEDVAKIYRWLRDPRHQVAIVVGPTGSGKSTALLYWLMDPSKGVPRDFFTRDGQIITTEPRIPATHGVAGHTASIVGSGVGADQDIGVRNSRSRDTYSPGNTIVYETDGTLVNMVKSGYFVDYRVVVLDEAHERSLNIDTLLRLFKEYLPVYGDLKLIIASATIDPKQFLDYFGRETAKVFKVAGKEVKYEVNFAPRDKALPYEDVRKLRKVVVSALAEKVVWLLKEIAAGRKDRWDILAFLHGAGEIEDAVSQIRERVKGDKRLAKLVEVYPWYRELPQREQERITATKRNPQKVRVIVATNIAETSVTLDGVVYLVDSGLEKQSQWDTELSSDNLVPVLISKAAAKQRWGRSGRTRDGEVYCLYTKEQFETLMPEYPVPEIQRSSMEDRVLLGKSSGLEDAMDGWMDAPLTEEVKRSSNVLRKKQAIGEYGLLTEYGDLLGRFPCPPRVADLVLAADRLGCAVEVATLLPVIKNGGERQLLAFDKAWDAETSYRATKIHQALMQGCWDDVEFILKLYSLWENPEDPTQASERGKRKLEDLRKSWADEFFVNPGTFRKIEKERNRLLESLSLRARYSDHRPIDFGSLNRVRLLLSVFLKDEGYLVTRPQGAYRYEPNPDLIRGTLVNCKGIVLPGWEELLGSLENSHSVSKPTLGLLLESSVEMSDEERLSLLSRLFVDQAFPLETTVGKEPPFLDLEIKYKTKPSRKVGGKGGTAKVVGYDFSDPCEPCVLLDLTTARKRSSRKSVAKGCLRGKFTAVVKESTRFSVGSGGVLVVRDKATGTEFLVSPEDLGFTYHASVLDAFEPGMSFSVETALTSSGSGGMAHLSLLPHFEQKLNALLEREPNGRGVYETSVVVVDVWEDRVFLRLDEWSDPGEAFVVLASVPLKRVNIPIEKLEEGQSYLIRVKRQDRRWEHGAKLSELPREAKLLLAETRGLEYKDGQLRYAGRLGYQEALKLKKACSDSAFQDAVNRLYRSSNELYVEGFVDEERLARLEAAYAVGKKVKVTISRLNKGGAVVQLKEGVRGFIPKSKIYDSDYAEGARVKAEVIDFDRSSMQVTFNAKIAENDPFRKLRVGQSFSGEVTGVKDFGIFVRLPVGIDGLLHKSQMGAKRPEDFRIGESVGVEILELDPVQRKISLRLKGVTRSTSRRAKKCADPGRKAAPKETRKRSPRSSQTERRYAPGERVEGTVSAVKEYGIFVELESGVIGFVHVSKMWGYIEGVRSLAERGLKEGRKVAAKVIEFDEDRQRYQLDMRSPEEAQRLLKSMGSVVRGRVSGVESYGAFVQLPHGLRGMVHVSTLTGLFRVKDMRQKVCVGEEVRVKIIKYDVGERRGKPDLRIDLRFA